jgi:hypothetical protein
MFKTAFCIFIYLSYIIIYTFIDVVNSKNNRIRKILNITKLEINIVLLLRRKYKSLYI